MSQFDFGTIDPNSKSGPQLALDLNNFRDALNTLHRGEARPGYIQTGMLWVKEVSSERWDLVMFDGQSDLTLRSINPATSEIIKFASSDIAGLDDALASSVKKDAATTSGAAILPVGTDAQRPGVPVNGMLRYSTDAKGLELYQEGKWVKLADIASSVRFFGELVQLPSRQSSPDGVIKADGQWITNAIAQYPTVVADLQSATPSVPVVTPAVWSSDPLSRAAWAYDAANDRIRVPDWNGMQPGSIGPLMFRGDGTLGFAPGKARMDQIQNITGEFSHTVATGAIAASGDATGVFGRGAASAGRPQGITEAGSNNLLFDASRVARTGIETFGKHGVGVWGVVLFGSVSNPGAADAAALATSYANQQAAITALQAKPGIGWGQSYQDVTASRVIGTTYTNSTGRPLLVIIAISQGTSGVTAVDVDGVQISRVNPSGSGEVGTFYFVVPNGSTYNVRAVSGSRTLFSWVELR
ncbi:hypothetical protein IRZ59_04965 [Pseudomonas guariconensis]|uniref:hypothetical protein n=1 Tax=Pseudomonas guariconensis TaxID=1288410 RepID=UPI0018AA3CE6|nr:hypothetical protein [Pseudomonas guariconensis]MBF8729788.1 hypothetical protein [Pseudomonas guariconensis]